MENMKKKLKEELEVLYESIECPICGDVYEVQNNRFDSINWTYKQKKDGTTDKSKIKVNEIFCVDCHFKIPAIFERNKFDVFEKVYSQKEIEFENLQDEYVIDLSFEDAEKYIFVEKYNGLNIPQIEEYWDLLEEKADYLCYGKKNSDDLLLFIEKEKFDIICFK